MNLAARTGPSELLLCSRNESWPETSWIYPLRSSSQAACGVRGGIGRWIKIRLWFHYYTWKLKVTVVIFFPLYLHQCFCRPHVWPWVKQLMWSDIFFFLINPWLSFTVFLRKHLSNKASHIHLLLEYLGKVRSTRNGAGNLMGLSFWISLLSLMI